MTKKPLKLKVGEELNKENLKIAILGDFFGNQFTCNMIIIHTFKICILNV